MKSVNKLQVGIIAGAILLFVLLYFANKKPVKKAEELAASSIKGNPLKADLSTFAATKVSLLPEASKQKFNVLLKAIDSGKDKVKALDSMIVFWDELKQPDMACVYLEKKALFLNKASEWFKAGERYFYSVRFIRDQNEIPVLYQAAINCFNKGLVIEPNNVDAKVNLAACFVDGTEDPMKGIGMLREIEKTDSNNVNLQLTFALFSSKSQQWSKAIKRYEKVIKLKPNYLDAYLYLADAYEKNGNIAKTIETLEQFVRLSTDEQMRSEVKNYIEKLKK